MASRAPRVIAIGDLNGSCEVLRAILRGLRVTDRHDKWKARNTHVIQLGDVFNRGPAAREALQLLVSLRDQAPARGSQVSVLLGNHEVMTALGNEAYCTAPEYLSFASAAQRRAWPAEREAAMRRLYRDHPKQGPIRPLGPRLSAWEIDHVPGRAEMRRALGPRAALGRTVRSLPIAVVAADCVFAHAPITPRWARGGVEALNAEARAVWRTAPKFYRDLSRRTVLAATHGPLWNRALVLAESERTRVQLERSLELLAVSRMVVGHTQTAHIPGGKCGRIHLRHRRRLVCIDVGLGRSARIPAALVIENGVGQEWTPAGLRPLWRSRATS